MFCTDTHRDRVTNMRWESAEKYSVNIKHYETMLTRENFPDMEHSTTATPYFSGLLDLKYNNFN